MSMNIAVFDAKASYVGDVQRKVHHLVRLELNHERGRDESAPTYNFLTLLYQLCAPEIVNGLLEMAPTRKRYFRQGLRILPLHRRVALLEW